MSNINDSGPAFRCRCGEQAHKKQGNQLLCARHYRFRLMRSKAKADGKAVPSVSELELMLKDECPECGAAMNTITREGEQARTASLQHYRDGSMAIVCLSCNARHAAMPGDSFRDMPKDHKWCPQCEMAKPFSEYSADNGRSGPMKLKSWRKQCSSKSHTEWQRNNRDHYNAKQREGRARRATSG